MGSRYNFYALKIFLQRGVTKFSGSLYTCVNIIANMLLHTGATIKNFIV